MNSQVTVKRIAILWKHVTGYLQAGLRALLADESVQLLLIQNRLEANTHFAPFQHPQCQFMDIGSLSPNDTSWLSILDRFQPQLALISGDKDSRYRQAAAQVKQQGGITVWASDRVLRVPIQDTYQMFLGRVARLWRDYDAAFVPGYAATMYARRIGFLSERIFQCLYTCDTELYRPIGLHRHSENNNISWPKVFLFVGQFVERKGIDTLLAAYQLYRQQSVDPWELWCAGAGPLRALLKDQPGVRILDFLPPQDCAKIMGQAGALILPSRWDHWGVVIHEATCAGLPIIASRQCRATVELVQDGFNGFTFNAGNATSLNHLLLRCSTQPNLSQWGANSLNLSYRFDPNLFAWQILTHIPTTLG